MHKPLRLAATMALRFFIRNVAITQHRRMKIRTITPMTIPATFPILLFVAFDPLLSCVDGLPCVDGLASKLVAVSGGMRDAVVVRIEVIWMLGALDAVDSSVTPSGDVFVPPDEFPGVYIRGLSSSTPLSSPEAVVVVVLVAIALVVTMLVVIVLVVIVLVGMVMMLMVVRLLPASRFELLSPCVTLAIRISNTTLGWHSSIHPTYSQELSEFDNSASFLSSPRVYDGQCMPCVWVQVSHAEQHLRFIRL